MHHRTVPTKRHGQCIDGSRLVSNKKKDMFQQKQQFDNFGWAWPSTSKQFSLFSLTVQDRTSTQVAERHCCGNAPLSMTRHKRFVRSSIHIHPHVLVGRFMHSRIRSCVGLHFDEDIRSKTTPLSSRISPSLSQTGVSFLQWPHHSTTPALRVVPAALVLPALLALLGLWALLVPPRPATQLPST